MNTSWFYMFHHTHYMEVLTIKDTVDLCLLATVQEVVDQDLVTRQVL
jgi:hypothetical protein